MTKLKMTHSVFWAYYRYNLYINYSFNKYERACPGPTTMQKKAEPFKHFPRHLTGSNAFSIGAWWAQTLRSSFVKQRLTRPPELP